MSRFNKGLIRVLGVFLLLIPITVNAASGTITYASKSLNINQSADIDVILSSASDVQAVGSGISSADTSCVKINSITAANSSASVFGTRFAMASMGEIPSNTTLVKVNVTGLKNCVTKLNFSDASVTSTSSVDYDATIVANNITVGNSSTPKSSDAALKTLTISKGTLEFSPNVTTYDVEVENDVTSINVSATTNDTKARITEGTGNKSLSVGSNKIEVKVTAEDGTTSRTYTINVTRKSSGSEGEGGDTPTPVVDDDRSKDNNLKNLEVVGHTFSPSFTSDNTSYYLEVDNKVTSIEVKGTPNDSKAKAIVLGNGSLNVGVNNVNVVVTAEDGSQKVYSIKVVRKGDNNSNPVENKSSEARLKSIFVGNGTLTPVFNSDTTSYDIVVANDVNELDLTATPMDTKARVQISNNGDFVVGETKAVQITVTAEDGSQKIYTINVKKSEKESKNKLTGITIDGTTLIPGFNPNTTIYTAEVGSGTNSINVKATPENENAKVEYSINGSEFKEDGNLDLQDGNNVVIVKVTDENGFVQMYTVNVERKSSTFELFGIKMPKWLGYTLLGLLLLLLAFLIFLVLRRRNKKQSVIQQTQAIPNIEIKPEFNFGSKNEDNDTVEDGGILNQHSNDVENESEDHDNENSKNKIEKNNEDEIPYDPYDEIVTKDEIIDAINEKDPDKLKMLYKQEMLNREKEKLKEKEEGKED